MSKPTVEQRVIELAGKVDDLIKRLSQHEQRLYDLDGVGGPPLAGKSCHACALVMTWKLDEQPEPMRCPRCKEPLPRVGQSLAEFLGAEAELKTQTEEVPA